MVRTQLTQEKVQKSTSTTLPRSSARARGGQGRGAPKPRRASAGIVGGVGHGEAHDERGDHREDAGEGPAVGMTEAHPRCIAPLCCARVIKKPLKKKRGRRGAPPSTWV